MCHCGSVNLEVGARVGFLRLDDLLDRHGSEGFFAIRLFVRFKRCSSERELFFFRGGPKKNNIYLAAALAVLLRSSVDEAAGVVASLGSV